MLDCESRESRVRSEEWEIGHRLPSILIPLCSLLTRGPPKTCRHQILLGSLKVSTNFYMISVTSSISSPWLACNFWSRYSELKGLLIERTLHVLSSRTLNWKTQMNWSLSRIWIIFFVLLKLEMVEILRELSDIFCCWNENKSDETHVWPCFLLQKIRCWLCAFVFKDERVTWVKKLQTVREIDNEETKRIVVLHIEKILYFQVECLVLNVIIAWQYIPYIDSNVKTN